MRCPQCGFDNPAGMKFCGDCGTAFQHRCPHCGFANPPRFKFCGACGTPLAGPPPVSSPPQPEALPTIQAPQAAQEDIP
jgi:adenylate cyclase